MSNMIFMHLLITLIVSFICFVLSGKRQYYFYFFIALFLPIAGYVIDLFISIVRNKINSNVELEEDELEDFEEKMIITDLDKSSHSEVIALEDVMLSGSNKLKRKQMMNILTNDNLKNVDLLKVALRDEDIETSHYASVAIVDMKKKLDVNIQECSEVYKQDPGNIENLIKYKNNLKEYFDSKLLDEHYIKLYKEMYTDIMELLLSKDKRKEYYVELIDVLIELKQWNKAKFYIDEFICKFMCEESYLKKLKYYYEINEKKQFYRVLSDLKKSSIKLSREGINIIRFWNRGGQINEV